MSEFDRLTLKAVRADLKQHLPKIKPRMFSVINQGRGRYEVRWTSAPNIPEAICWQGRAENATQARTDAYGTLLGKAGIEGYSQPLRSSK